MSSEVVVKMENRKTSIRNPAVSVLFYDWLGTQGEGCFNASIVNKLSLFVSVTYNLSSCNKNSYIII